MDRIRDDTIGQFLERFPIDNPQRDAAVAAKLPRWKQDRHLRVID